MNQLSEGMFFLIFGWNCVSEVDLLQNSPIFSEHLYRHIKPKNICYNSERLNFFVKQVLPKLHCGLITRTDKWNQICIPEVTRHKAILSDERETALQSNRCWQLKNKDTVSKNLMLYWLILIWNQFYVYMQQFKDITLSSIF